MDLDKFQEAWREEAAQIRVPLDADLLSQKVKQSQSSFESTIQMRDVREIGVALIMIPMWCAIGLAFSSPWTWYLTIPVLLWIAAFMLIDRWRHPMAPASPGEPLTFYCQESLKQVEHQIWLLRNIFWWYLLPPFISISVFFLHVGWDSTGSWWGAAIVGGFGVTFIFYVYRWIYRLNQTAVREQLEPRRDKLRQLICSFESSSVHEGAGDILDLVPAWPDISGKANIPENLVANWAAWAENWNRIVPSWREVAIILAPTLLGAFCGWWFAIPDIGPLHVGPVFFQSVVAAVIPFEIAFFSLWYRSSKRHRNQPLPSEGATRPKAPALFTLAMIIAISVLAIAALVAFGKDQQSRRVPTRPVITSQQL